MWIVRAGPYQMLILMNAAHAVLISGYLYNLYVSGAELYDSECILKPGDSNFGGPSRTKQTARDW
ncbi:hypothetical protein NBRC116601_09900 [Cognatishimia sp. WU-CL00825]